MRFYYINEFPQPHFCYVYLLSVRFIDISIFIKIILDI